MEKGIACEKCYEEREDAYHAWLDNIFPSEKKEKRDKARANTKPQVEPLEDIVVRKSRLEVGPNFIDERHYEKDDTCPKARTHRAFLLLILGPVHEEPHKEEDHDQNEGDEDPDDKIEYIQQNA